MVIQFRTRDWNSLVLSHDAERLKLSTFPSCDICALLGLQMDFLDRLDEVPPEDCDHFTLCDWIVIFLSNNHESVDSIDKNCLTKDLLAAIGFDPLSSAVDTTMARAGSTQHHIETCEVAELFIRDEFKYNPLLSSMVGRFPFQSYLTNSWFQFPPSTTDEEGEGEDYLPHQHHKPRDKGIPRLYSVDVPRFGVRRRTKCCSISWHCSS